MLPIPVQSKILGRKGNQHFRVGSCEMQGYRINMEDAHTIRLSLGGKHAQKAFFGLFDGHGSDKASLFMAEKLWRRVREMESHSQKDLAQKVEELDEEFLKSPEGDKENGSTVVFVVVDEFQKKDGVLSWKLSVGNLGDSRAILIRADGKCEPLTKDHKPENDSELKRIEAAGGFVRINRVDGQIAVSRAIGDVKYKGAPDKKPSEQKVIAVPDVEIFEAYQGDRLLLFCDGVVEKMTNEDVSSFIHKGLTEMKEKKEPLDPAAVLEKLLQISLEKGSRDNMSAVMVIFDSGVGYDKKNEFIAGPFYQFAALNEEFRVAYLLDAKKHGFEGQSLVALLSTQQVEMEQRQKQEKEAAEAAAASPAMISPPLDPTGDIPRVGSGVGTPPAPASQARSPQLIE